jgi:hypothetical protein
MPYTITTIHPDRSEEDGGSAADERQAVATLDEARNAVWQAVQAQERFRADAFTITESGGSVGPLPDGTVITIEPS